MSALSLGVVDHDPLVLYALRDLVQRSSERIRLLWSVRSRRAALRHLAADEPTPDVILVDTVSDRSEESAPLEKEASQAGVAVVAMSASGVLDRKAPRPEGVHGPRAVVPKEALLGGGTIRQVLLRAATPVASKEADDGDGGAAEAPGAAAPSAARPLSALLSDRERRAIELYAQGMTTQSVAHRMSVSETTVKTYARRAYKKLGVGSRAEAVAVLARRGVI